MHQQNRAVIDLGAIRANARFLRGMAGTKLCAVVKADAYGHGAARVARSLQPYADCFAVALVEEGARLRHAGVTGEILVLCPPLCEEEVLRGMYHRLTFTVGDGQDARLLLSASRRFDGAPRCHLKVDTGMNRFGFGEEDFAAFLRSRDAARLHPTGIYSHLYRPEHVPTVRAQAELFARLCDRAQERYDSLCRHIAATGGVLAGGCSLDMVRVGIGLYGYAPAGFFCPPLRPALRVYSAVAAEHAYRGGGAGYGGYVPSADRLSVLRTGYADGFFRTGTGRNALCMDAAVCERAAEKYDEVCVFSDADAYAACHGTISYEALVRVCGRAVKEYVDG